MIKDGNRAEKTESVRNRPSGETIFDVAVIGAGVTGASIVRELSKYQLSVALLEKEVDVSFGVSKGNSGIIHAGFHHPLHSLKGKLENEGNPMFDELKEQLHFPFKRVGIIVAAFTVEEMRTVERLYQTGVENGIQGIEICNREKIHDLEPKLNPDVIGGLYAPTGGIIEPYRFVFSLVESAIRNGVRLFTRFKVEEVERSGDTCILKSGTERITARYCINAAGLFADEISALFNAEPFSIIPRKGEEFLMDKNAKAFTNHVVFPVPSPISKGMLVIPTVEGTCMVGPTAEQRNDKTDFSTSAENFEKVFYSARRLIPSVSEGDIITSFSGLRPTLEGNDFFIAQSEIEPRLIHAAGIQSPGLTAAPAIGKYTVKLLKDAGCPMNPDPSFVPEIEEVPRVRNANQEELDALIKKNPDYGEIVCRCESVSKAEIIAAIKHGHTTMDGIKFFTRAGMGRCQGGFCTARIMKIITQETDLSFRDITKRGGESRMILGEISMDGSTLNSGGSSDE